MNSFPSPAYSNIDYVVTRHELEACCGTFTVLPDFWIFWAIHLNIPRRGGFYQLTLNSVGHVPTASVPTGAASTAANSEAVRRYRVYKGQQLHGDIEERIGKTRISPWMIKGRMHCRSHLFLKKSRGPNVNIKG